MVLRTFTLRSFGGAGKVPSDLRSASMRTARYFSQSAVDLTPAHASDSRQPTSASWSRVDFSLGRGWSDWRKASSVHGSGGAAPLVSAASASAVRAHMRDLLQAIGPQC